MSEQPKALRLADGLGDLPHITTKDVAVAAAELRRLYAVNVVLLVAIRNNVWN